jgi:deazaflavin-dependent oxidoreductase (nitroreductase family)
MPAVELETIGRRTGQVRSTMLTSPLHDDRRVVLVASRGGSDYHPAWYVNLSADPDVKVTMYGQSRQMRARTASPEEKAALWPEIVAVYKNYEGYQKRSSRDIPVVICEPPPAPRPS